MNSADVVLLLANVLYGTSYLASRLALDLAPPSTLAFVRLLLALALLGALAARRPRAPRTAPRAPSRSTSDRWRIAAMGVFGFSAAYALSHWGDSRRSAPRWRSSAPCSSSSTVCRA